MMNVKIQHLAAILITAIIYAALAAPVTAFNYAAYEPVDLDAILEDTSWAVHGGGDSDALTVLEPRKIRFEATLKTQAYACSPATLKMVFTILGVSSGVVERLELGYCVEAVSAKGQTVTFYIQGVLVAPLLEKVKTGEPVILFCDYLFWHNGRPGMLVSEFLTPNDALDNE